jgi:hypothetical protein
MFFLLECNEYFSLKRKKNLWMSGIFFFFKKINDCALRRGKKKTCIEGFFCLFFNSKMMELTLQFKKTKAICEGVLEFFDWFCCYF